MFLSLRVPRKTQRCDACLLLGCLFLLLMGGCSDTSSGVGHARCSTTTSLTGEGSTFDDPLFTKLFSVDPTTPCGLTVEYYPAGSGMRISMLLGQLVDFGATDAPLTSRQLASSSNGNILHVPVTLGLVAISYHLDGVSIPLQLTGSVLAAIYLGTITWWDDPAIQHLNPDIALPHLAIQVLHRSDGSGTTAIFTQYLASISPAWKARVGASTTVVSDHRALRLAEHERGKLRERDGRALRDTLPCTSTPARASQQGRRSEGHPKPGARSPLLMTMRE